MCGAGESPGRQPTSSYQWLKMISWLQCHFYYRASPSPCRCGSWTWCVQSSATFALIWIFHWIANRKASNSGFNQPVMQEWENLEPRLKHKTYTMESSWGSWAIIMLERLEHMYMPVLWLTLLITSLSQSMTLYISDVQVHAHIVLQTYISPAVSNPLDHTNCNHLQSTCRWWSWRYGHCSV